MELLLVEREAIKIQQFSWKAYDEKGVLHKGTIAAHNEPEAAEKVRVVCGVVVDIMRVRESCWQNFLHRKKYGDREREIFFKQMQIVLQSGLPIVQGVKILEHRMDKRMGKICRELYEKLHEGSSLASAMSCDRIFFTELAVTLVNAGEHSGELVPVFKELAGYYAARKEIKSFMVKSALYPLFLLKASFLLLLFFLLYVLPVLSTAYTSMEIRAGGLLEVLMQINRLLLESPLEAAAAGAAVIVFLLLSAGKLSKFALQVPPFKTIYCMIQEIRFCRVVALLLESGVGITDGVDVGAKTVGDDVFRKQLYLFNGRLKRGTDIGVALTCCEGIFSPLTLELLTVGAATGYLSRMLEEAARIREEELRNMLDKLREIFAPLLLLLVALTIGAVVCAVLEPLFGLFSAVPK